MRQWLAGLQIGLLDNTLGYYNPILSMKLHDFVHLEV